MSHELRTPLTSIIGYSDLLKVLAEARGYDEIVPDLDRIGAAGGHLLALISDILDLSKIEAGKLDLFLEKFNLPALVAYVATTVRPMVEQNRNTLTVDCPEAIGSMYADLTRVRQVLFNLLSNAAKFTNDGTITLRVSRQSAAAVRDRPAMPTGLQPTVDCRLGHLRDHRHRHRHEPRADRRAYSRNSCRPTHRPRASTAAPAWGWR